MNNDKPVFGKWSFDYLNRKKYDNTYTEPQNKIYKNKYITEAREYINKNWKNNFGSYDNFIFPITNKDAKKVFKDFLKHKLNIFGKYQDGVRQDIIIGSHSLLSCVLNTGLIEINYILDKIKKIKITKTNIQNIEAFIRQLIGWRSYVRYVYLFYGKDMMNDNILGHTRKLNWLDNYKSNLYPIDFLIDKVHKYAYLHHIERLMFIGNFCLLCEIDPKEVYKWFMICFIDSYEWVMVANVFSMSQWSSKIKIMKRPYFCSSNYIKLMSDFKLNSYEKINVNGKYYYWNEILDALYYNFINNNIKLLKNNYSVANSVRHLMEIKNGKEILNLGRGLLPVTSKLDNS